MLKTIKVKNFKCHKNSILDLSPGVNIISGSSDQGKSDISRAINLVVKNRPSGYGYKPWKSKKNIITENILVFDNGQIEKRRSNSIDEYLIKADGYIDQPFTALNRQVPEEVTEFLNLAEYNLQEQHDPYFFLSSTPGERAKLLNEISGLEIIDKSTAKINSLIKENTHNLEKTKNEIKSLIDKKEKIKFVTDANILLTFIEEGLGKIKELNLSLDILRDFCFNIENIEKDINDLKTFLKIKTDYQLINGLILKAQILKDIDLELEEYINKNLELEKIIKEQKEFLKIKNLVLEIQELIKKHIEITFKNKNLENYCFEVQENEDNIKNIKEWLEVKIKYASIIQYKAQIEELETRQSTLRDYVENVTLHTSMTSKWQKKVEVLKNKKEEYIKQFSICPFCGRGD